jgi:hypothetical protein
MPQAPNASVDVGNEAATLQRPRVAWVGRGSVFADRRRRRPFVVRFHFEDPETGRRWTRDTGGFCTPLEAEAHREQFVGAPCLGTMIRRQRVRQWLADYKAHYGCAHCPEHDPSCLDFHHRDPDSKVMAVSQVNFRAPVRAILEEIVKCTILCANCHRKLHSELSIRRRRRPRKSNQAQEASDHSQTRLTGEALGAADPGWEFPGMSKPKVPSIGSRQVGQAGRSCHRPQDA